MWIMLAVLNPLWPMRRWNIITCNAPAIRDLSRDQPPNLLNENSAHHIENGKSHDTPAQIVDRCTWWWEYCFSAFQSKWPMSNFRKFWISDSSCIQGSIVPSPSQIAVFWWISDAFRPVKEEKQGKPFADVLHQNPTCRSPIGKHHFKPQRKRPQTSMCCELKQWFIFVAFHQWQQWSLKKQFIVAINRMTQITVYIVKWFTPSDNFSYRPKFNAFSVLYTYPPKKNMPQTKTKTWFGLIIFQKNRDVDWSHEISKCLSRNCEFVNILHGSFWIVLDCLRLTSI